MLLMRQDKPGIQGLKDLIACLPDDIVGLEIGCYAGESTRIFVESGKFKILYCLDFWKEGFYKDRTTSDAEKVFDELAENSEVVVKLKEDSNRVINLFTGKRIDFIYIDADHEYEQVKKDIENAIQLNPKYLGGHDYVPEFPGVMRAVDELPYVKRHFADSSWLIEF